MNLDDLFQALDWPHPAAVWDPPGAGARELARVTRSKVGLPLEQILGQSAVQVGVLTEDPLADTTPPLAAIVINFKSPVDRETVVEAHRLAWNFCRSQLLVTLEPHQIRAWTCWERPCLDSTEEVLPLEALQIGAEAHLLKEASRSLNMVYLATGAFVDAHRERFPEEQRADRLLLSNLAHVRKILTDLELKPDTVHDLLARLIFVQFLSQRRDSSGTPALDKDKFAALFEAGLLQNPAECVEAVLRNKWDTYSFFKWLDRRFNGDLFPGKGSFSSQDDQAWWDEMHAVSEKHLRVLADFVAGTLRFDDNQRSLWPLYSFDAIPLEFISSIYEQFVSEDAGAIGAHYTPASIVDVVLDQVLPWDGANVDVKILDPSCGSGIFLVKAFQRLVARWRACNPGRAPSVKFLTQLLEKNLYGVDVNPHAVRVASFSLYLAMCDEIDPITLWEDVRFPHLRGKTLISRDYFEVSWGADLFDLVVGNAPWGEGSLTERAAEWAKDQGWLIVNQQIGTLFLAKAAGEVGLKGRVALLQPAGSLLHNKNPTAERFRSKLLNEVRVTHIIDFSALRLLLFPNSVSPICLVILSPGEPPGHLTYIRPRALEDYGAFKRIVIEEADTHNIDSSVLLASPWLWSALAWGGRRNIEILAGIIRRVRSGALLRLSDLKERDGWLGREGYKRGKTVRTLKKPELAKGQHVDIKSANISKGEISGTLQVNDDPWFHHRDIKDSSIFYAPLLLLAKTWKAGVGFCAAISEDDAIFPASSLYGFRFPPEDWQYAAAAMAVFNSKFAEWYLTMTSGRATNYRPEVLASELLDLPIGAKERIELSSLGKDFGDQEVFDRAAADLLELKEVEWIVIEDFVTYEIPRFRRRTLAVGTARPSRDDLAAYCEFFLRSLEESVGTIGAATVFNPPPTTRLNLRVLAVHFGEISSRRRFFEVSVEEEDGFLGLLHRLDSLIGREGVGGGSHIAWKKVVKVFDLFESGEFGATIPTVYLVKPDERSYWTRSAALEDADSAIADVVTWHLTSPQA